MTEPRPLVGLSTSWDPDAGSHGRPQAVLYAAYIESLERAGLAAVLITPAHSAEAIAALMAHCDGLVLSGGGDIDPTRYGQECMPGLDSVSAERDDAEFAALREAMRRHIPIFGICRGAQVLNVALGGTLFQDIDRDRPIPSATHQQKGPWSARAHEVTVTPDSRLIDIVGASQLHINSFHHQAIRDVAPGLTVTALAEDGVIEALEMRDYPWGLAVQWHPERNEASADHTHPDRRLFTAFARAVKSRTRATSGAKR